MQQNQPATVDCAALVCIAHKSLRSCERRRLDPGVFMARERKARKPVTREISNPSAGATVVALFLATMLQWAAVLAVCPSVHELIHHDADDEHHDCAVTL